MNQIRTRKKDCGRYLAYRKSQDKKQQQEIIPQYEYVIHHGEQRATLSKFNNLPGNLTKFHFDIETSR
jgi:hypothetical protein